MRWCQQVALRDAYPMLAQGDHLLWTFYPFSDQLRADPGSQVLERLQYGQTAAVPR